MDNLKRKFSKIYDQNVGGIYRFVYFKVSSEDIAQDLTSEAFLKTWQVFREKGEEIKNPRAFIYRTARNLVIDYYRKKGRTETVSIENVSLPDTSSDLEKSVLINSDFEQVKGALSKLSDNYQNVIIMHYIEGMSPKEVSKAIHKSEGATRVLLHRALNLLRQKIEEA